MQQLSANQGDDKPKSRRACYNALVRLKENPGRMKALPNDLRKRLLEEDGLSKVPSDLVNLMMDVGGDLSQLSMRFNTTAARITDVSDRQGMRLHTETEIFKMYNEADAKIVMENKKKEGLTTKDLNHPDKLCYWMYCAEKEVNNTNRNSILPALRFWQFWEILLCALYMQSCFIVCRYMLHEAMQWRCRRMWTQTTGIL